MDQHSSNTDASLDDHTKMSEGGLTPRGILNGTAFKTGNNKYSHPFYEAASSRGGFGFISIPPSPRISNSRMYGAFHMNSEINPDTIKLNSKSMSYFPSLPAIPVTPKEISKLKSSVNRLAQSDSNIPPSSFIKQSNNTPRKPTTISIPRTESFKPPKTAPSKFRYSSNSDRNKPNSQTPAKSWKNEVTLSNFTMMNPNETNLESISLEELENKITEKASFLSFEEMSQTPYGDITKQLSRYIGKPSFGGGNQKPSSSSGSKRTPQTPTSKHADPEGTSFPKASNEEVVLHRSPSDVSQSEDMIPCFAQFIQTDIARRMLKMLQGIGVGQDRPATPRTARNETLQRLKKAYKMLQEELNGLNINEEAFLTAKGIGSTYFKTPKTPSKDLKMLGNGKRPYARMRTATAGRQAMRGNSAPLQEICDTFKGLRVPRNMKECIPMSARTCDDHVKQNFKSSLKLNNFKRPATTQAVRISPFLSENFKLQDQEMYRRKNYSKGSAEYRSKMSNTKLDIKPVPGRSATSVTSPNKKLNPRTPVNIRLDLVK